MIHYVDHHVRIVGEDPRSKIRFACGKRTTVRGERIRELITRGRGEKCDRCWTVLLRRLRAAREDMARFDDAQQELEVHA